MTSPSLPWILPHANFTSKLLKAFGYGDPIPHTPEQMQALADQAGCTLAEMQAIMDDENTWPILINDLYQVAPRWDRDGTSPVVHLSLKRRDKAPVHDWRHMQEIKNMIVGPEYEGLELYPAESRLVDTANQYHIWVIRTDGYQLPFGFAQGRMADYRQTESGARQRAFGSDK